MPEFAVISGQTVRFTSFAENEESYTGEETVSFANTLLSSRSNPVRSWAGVTIPYTPAEMAIVRTLVGNGAVALACSGPAFQGINPTCTIRITNKPYTRDRSAADGYKVEYTFEFRQA